MNGIGDVKMFFYNLISNFQILLNQVFDGSTGAEQAAEAVGDAANAAATAAPPGGLMGTISSFLMWGLLIVAVYFFMFRQPRKEQKEKNAMRESIKIGDSVLTTSGFYGKIVDIGDNVFVLEFGNSRGVRIPVRKEVIEKIEEPMLTQAKETEASK